MATLSNTAPEVENPCSICMDAIIETDAQNPSKQLPCKHTFHKTCIVEWIKKHPNCPLCRDFYLSKIPGKFKMQVQRNYTGNPLRRKQVTKHDNSHLPIIVVYTIFALSTLFHKLFLP